MGYYQNKEFMNIKTLEINKEYKIKIQNNKIKLQRKKNNGSYEEFNVFLPTQLVDQTGGKDSRLLKTKQF